MSHPFDHSFQATDSPMDYYDISPEISEKISVWPGDTPFQRKNLVDYETGGTYLLSTITTTVHLGAHADAPNHYDSAGVGISERSLHHYLGTCQVLSLPKAPHTRIYPEDLTQAGYTIQAPRVLFKTDSFPKPENWNTDFQALSPELIHFLARQGVILVGIDTPSIDLFDSKKLESHSAVFQNNLAILEGLVLTQVPDGLYTLIALPLKIKNADASPVRAILLKNGAKR